MDSVSVNAWMFCLHPAAPLRRGGVFRPDFILAPIYLLFFCTVLFVLSKYLYDVADGNNVSFYFHAGGKRSHLG